MYMSMYDVNNYALVCVVCLCPYFVLYCVNDFRRFLAISEGTRGAVAIHCKGKPCVCVCVCGSMCVYMHVCICIYMYVCARVCVCMFTRTCVHSTPCNQRWELEHSRTGCWLAITLQLITQLLRTKDHQSFPYPTHLSSLPIVIAPSY